MINIQGQAPSDADLIEYALLKSGLDRGELVADMDRCSAGLGRITTQEYVELGLYDWDTFSVMDRSSFISDQLHWPIVAKSCDTTWFAATEDKWIAETLLNRAGVPTPQNLAVVDAGIRLYPGTKRIANFSQFREFLSTNGGKPFFCKELRGMASVGIFLCEASSHDEVQLAGEGVIPASALYERLEGSRYLLQGVVGNHSSFSDMTARLSTMRIAVFVFDDTVRVAFAFLKVAADNNIADHFKPVGNIALGIDIQSGKTTIARERLDIGARTLDVEAGQRFVGRQLPFWPETLKLVAYVAQVFAPVRFQSMDIAFTNSGPMLIEVNTGGGFGGPQLVYGQGLLQPHFLHFLQECRVDLASLGA